ncbi:hypothetical protein AMK16_13015 [Streptomyces sp. CB00455]|uniref:hypothetical protein n=1 Tax=Streptomyces sp. CB00455 TaxID=1703927 RepID=UPI00093E57EA|nr:hypothetical protein [Streptomyces sp. CB00455]OKK19778.1 hypothetical protein AMK16_13015 [Streptomyces sp. CB00455]
MTLRATAAAAVLAATALLGLAPQAAAAPVPQPGAASAENRAAAARAAAAPDTLATLSRFFSREGKVSLAAAQPRIEGEAVPVSYLSPDFVAGKAGAPVARLEFLASKAVSSDGQQAALWTARTAAGWQVVNIATGDDEFRYAQLGAAKLPGGTVFREPQIDAWYVAGGSRVLPLDEDAVRAVGAGGSSLAAYRARVGRAYGDKLPGSAYAKDGRAGGYAEAGGPAGAAGPALPVLPVLPVGVVAGGGALVLLGAAGVVVVRRGRRAGAADALA